MANLNVFDVVDLCESDGSDDGGGKVPAAAAAQPQHKRRRSLIDLSSSPPPRAVAAAAAAAFALVAATRDIVDLLDLDHSNSENESNRKPAAQQRARTQAQTPPSARKRSREMVAFAARMAGRKVRRDARKAAPVASNDTTIMFPTPSDAGVAPRVAKRPVLKTHTPPRARAQTQTQTQTPRPKTPLERVFEVFPDVQKEHAEKTLRDCNQKIEMTLSILAERDYPKEQGILAGARRHAAANNDVGCLVRRGKTQPKYDYLSPSCFDPSETYVQESNRQLLHEFAFVSISGMKLLVQQHKRHYSIVRKFLLDCLKGIGDKKSAAMMTDEQEIAQYEAFKGAWASKKPTPSQVTRVGQDRCLKRTMRRDPPRLTDPILREEIKYAREQLNEWMESMEKMVQRHEARKRTEMSGNGVECGCCFGKVPIDEMVACRDEGHLFCMDCIQRYAHTAVFNTASLGVLKAAGKPSCELLCCDASGCQSGFHEAHLQKALPMKTLEKYNELQFRATIEAAGLQEEICTCPKCGFQADLPSNLVVFQCPMEDCRHESCRKCGKAPHIPLRCEEVVQKKREDEGRLKVEEAMAEAKIRKCPKCKTSFVKSDGCNKMTCRCGLKLCYICRVQLSAQDPYKHFCQTAHCTHGSCGKCTLYSNADEDDQRAMREAGLTAAQTYRKELQSKDPGGDVQIDVDQIMNKGVAIAQRGRVGR